MSHVFGAFPNGLSLFLPERERQLRSVKEAFLWEFTGVERRLKALLVYLSRGKPMTTFIAQHSLSNQ